MQLHILLTYFEYHDTPFTLLRFVTAVAGVHDGYVLTKSVSRSPIGGRLLNSCLQKAMEARGNQLRPRQTFTRVEKKGFPGEFDVSALGQFCISAWLLRLSH
jgi:hypothetical protein